MSPRVAFLNHFLNKKQSNLVPELLNKSLFIGERAESRKEKQAAQQGRTAEGWMQN